MASIEDLERRIARIEDCEAIKRLQARRAPDRSEKSAIIVGVYTDRLVKLDGAWRIAHCQADFAFNADWDKGWVERRFR